MQSLLETQINTLTLREHCTTPKILIKQINNLEKTLKKNCWMNFSKLGNLYRLNNQLLLSQQSFKRANKLITQDQNLIINNLRWLLTESYLNNWANGLVIILKTARLIDSDKIHKKYLHFLRQHQAKFHFERKEFEQSLSYFKKAHHLRKVLSEELQYSSYIGIQRCQEFIT